MSASRKTKAFILSLLLMLIVPDAHSQMHEEVSVELVQVYVSVFSSNETLAKGLARDDFVIKENGELRKITHFERLLNEDSLIPLTIAFLIDTSGSMKKGEKGVRRIEVAKSFATLIMHEVKPQDRMQVFAFNIALWKLTEMTSEAEVVRAALNSAEPPPQKSPGTALLWAVDAVSRIIENEYGRKIMILLTDGENNMTEGPKINDVIQRLNRNDISVLALGTTNIREWEENIALVPVPGYEATNIPITDISTRKRNARRLINLLAEKSGGYAFFPQEMGEVEDSIDKFRRVLQSQYVISFRPKPKTNKSWQKIEVKCKRKRLQLRYRKGYFSGPPEQLL